MVIMAKDIHKMVMEETSEVVEVWEMAIPVEIKLNQAWKLPFRIIRLNVKPFTG